jgi:hypothetical protein
LNVWISQKKGYKEMNDRNEVIARFKQGGEGYPLFLPNFTLWHDWHRNRGSLPSSWADYSLPELAREFGCPAWTPVQPWRIDTPGVKIQKKETENKRIISYETGSGTLIEGWTYIPGSEWWQTEYPVKSVDDFPAALEYVNARNFVLDSMKFQEIQHKADKDVILGISIPIRPFSFVLGDLIGWTSGLIMLKNEQSFFQSVIDILESKLAKFMEELVLLQGEVFYSPDNLDGQFISPGIFQDYLSKSFRKSAEILHGHNSCLVVHTGGPIRTLLALLAESGVDVVEGVSGPPQSDATLTEARKISGQNITLWGGIPQNYLMNVYDGKKFEAEVRQAIEEATGDKRMILGVADRVPVEADIGRLVKIQNLLNKER